MRKRTSFVFIAGAAFLAASVFTHAGVAGEYPALGPLPKKAAPKAAAVEMGKRLFFDARISGDGAVACAFCHDPRQGYGKTTDKEGKPQALSEAYPGTSHYRNAPTLINTIYKADFADTGWGWDGHMGANLNDVVRNEITETAIMNMDMRIMHERMKQDPVYVEMCANVYGGECSSGKARKALVSYMETLVSKDVPFDQGKMSAPARRGRKLFEGKANCISCHNGPYFSDGKPHNTGVAENMDIFTDPVRHLTYRSVIMSHGVPNVEAWRRDVGYFMVSKDYEDVGKFVTPTLRELKYTGPYMHTGLFGSLSDVVEFYNDGGGHDDILPNELQPLGLTASEKPDLVAFLESLSSAAPIANEVVKVPQRYRPIKNWLDVKN